jgi:hypothetical protein
MYAASSFSGHRSDSLRVRVQESGRDESVFVFFTDPNQPLQCSPVYRRFPYGS